MKKSIIFLFAFILGILVTIAIFTGFFTVQPSTIIPDGLTLWYLRSGTDYPFISSAEGYLLKKNQNINVVSKAITLGTMLEETNRKKITKLPYIKLLYLLSTKGKEY